MNQILCVLSLEIFLSQRAVEMSEEGRHPVCEPVPAGFQPSCGPDSRQRWSPWCRHCRIWIGRLTSLRMQHLFMILASPRSGFPAVGLFLGMLQGTAILGGPASLFPPLCDPLDLIPASHNCTTPTRVGGFSWGKMGWLGHMQAQSASCAG